jgi:hypothetical protein
MGRGRRRREEAGGGEEEGGGERRRDEGGGGTRGRLATSRACQGAFSQNCCRWYMRALTISAGVAEKRAGQSLWQSVKLRQ